MAQPSDPALEPCRVQVRFRKRLPQHDYRGGRGQHHGQSHEQQSKRLLRGVRRVPVVRTSMYPHTFLLVHTLSLVSSCLVSVSCLTPRPWNTSAHCADGFSTSRTGGTVEACNPCQSGAETTLVVVWVLFLVVVILAGFTFGLWLAQRPTTDTVHKLSRKNDKMHAEAKILFGNTNCLLGAYVVWPGIAWRDSGGRVDCHPCAGLVQVLQLFGPSLQIEIPAPFKQLQSILSVLTLNVFAIVNFQCIYNYSFVSQFFMSACFPGVLVAAIGLIGWLNLARGKMDNEQVRTAFDEADEDHNGTLDAKELSGVLAKLHLHMTPEEVLDEFFQQGEQNLPYDKLERWW